MYPEEAFLFCQFMNLSYEPLIDCEKKRKILQAAHQTPSLFHINLLQEYLSFFPELVWLNAEDERINMPGTVLPTNWTYRYRPFLEAMIHHEGLSRNSFRDSSLSLSSRPGYACCWNAHGE